MVAVVAQRRSGGQRLARPAAARALVASAAALAVLACLAPAGSGYAAPGKPQFQKGPLRTRGNLKKHVLEIPLEEAEAELESLPELPPHRLPYTFHTVTHFPHGKHLQQDSPLLKYVSSKVQHALSNAEAFIRHVEVTVRVVEHFHRPKFHQRKSVTSRVYEAEDGQEVEVQKTNKMLAPYQVKVLVTLKNSKQIVFDNPEKHAQHSIQEATDVAAESIKEMMRKQKEIIIQNHRKASSEGDFLSVPSAEEEAAQVLQDAIDATEALEAENDARMEQMYRLVEEDDAGKRAA